MKHLNHKIKSFSLFEVTVVLAVLSILITIITVSLNRFNEQLKNNAVIYDEMNHFYAIRSTIWNDYYQSDSITFEQNKLNLFSDSKAITYFLEDDLLVRKNEQQIENLKLVVNEIKEEKKGDKLFYQINFDWKNEDLVIQLPAKKELKGQIDFHFKSLL